MEIHEYASVKIRKTGVIGVVCDIHNHVDGRKVYVIELLDKEKTGILVDDIIDCLEEELINLEKYTEKAFAMEVLTGKILSLKPEFQEFLVSKTTAMLNLTITELGTFLINHIDGEEDENLSAGESIADKYGFLLDYDSEELETIFGFDEVKRQFTYPGIQALESNLGWSVKGIAEELGCSLTELIDQYAHAYETDGVIFCEKV